MFPLPCLMVEIVFTGSKLAFSLQTRGVELMPKSSILVSSDHSTFSQPPPLNHLGFYLQTSDGPVHVLSWVGGPCEHYMFSVHYDLVLLLVILVSVIPAALRSTRSCRVVLRCSLTFLILRFTPRWEILRGGRLIVNRCFFHFLIIALQDDWQAAPRWEILRGAPDWGRLIVNQCFFYFLIIPQQFTPSHLLANRLVPHSSVVQVYHLVPDIFRQFFRLANCGEIRFWFIEEFWELVSFMQVKSTWLGVIID